MKAKIVTMIDRYASNRQEEAIKLSIRAMCLAVNASLPAGSVTDQDVENNLVFGSTVKATVFLGRNIWLHINVIDLMITAGRTHPVADWMDTYPTIEDLFAAAKASL